MDQSYFKFLFQLARKSKHSGLSKSEKSVAKRNATQTSKKTSRKIELSDVFKTKMGSCPVQAANIAHRTFELKENDIECPIVIIAISLYRKNSWERCIEND